MGLYTQRTPGIDGGKTATLEPEELDDKYFMMRVRIDGGQLSPEQLRTVGEISTEYARDTADITDRQNIQYHWIRIEDVPAIWERLEARRPDHRRGVRRLPARHPRLPRRRRRRGRDHRRHPGDRGDRAPVHRRPGVLEPAAQVQDRRYRGHPGHDVVPEINDIAFVGAVHPEHGPGFDLWVGGGLSTNPMLAQRLGVWVPLDEVPDVWEGVI